MDYKQALEKAYERWRAGLPSTVVHPFLPFAIKVNKDGVISIGPMRLAMTIEQFCGSKVWRLEG